MSKKNIILIIASGVVLLACIFLVLWKANVFSSKQELKEDMFAIKDSAKVNQILLADMHGNSVLMHRENGGWKLDDGTPVSEEKISALLGTMMSLRVDHPTSKKSIDNINRMMAAGAIKVEIYENAPKFRLFGHDFKVEKRKTKTYYMGPATQSNMGNYAILEGMEEMPCVVYLPGFRGFATPRYSAFRDDWIAHTLFNTKLTRIQEVTIQDYDDPASSFKVEKIDTRFFKLYDSKNDVVEHYDTTKLIDFLSEFRALNYEGIPGDLDAPARDSILQKNLFKTITVKDVNGKVTKLSLYRMDDDNEYYDENGNLMDKVEYLYNKDRCYGVLNDKTEQLYKIQYFHFDRVLQPFSFFLHQRPQNK